ncbi:MAG: NUDIX domain-containing protein [Candidatus Pacebacteria bacterium]|nr:NUDIX domain-containing protein [Candidatus Paceibacterota bacterium]
MKLLAEISEGTLGLSNQFEQLGTDYQLRKSARAILLNQAGEMVVQYLSKYNFHKLPGGGVEVGESIEETLRREVSEEVGCACEIIRPIGMTIEYRNESRLLQLSYCYEAKVVGEVGEPAWDNDEIEAEQGSLWLPPREALEKIKSDQPNKADGYFIQKREMSFLEEYLRS